MLLRRALRKGKPRGLHAAEGWHVLVVCKLSLENAFDACSLSQKLGNTPLPAPASCLLQLKVGQDCIGVPMQAAPDTPEYSDWAYYK